jgi:hypothetical protein
MINWLQDLQCKAQLAALGTELTKYLEGLGYGA